MHRRRHRVRNFIPKGLGGVPTNLFGVANIRTALAIQALGTLVDQEFSVGTQVAAQTIGHVDHDLTVGATPDVNLDFSVLVDAIVGNEVAALFAGDLNDEDINVTVDPAAQLLGQLEQGVAGQAAVALTSLEMLFSVGVAAAVATDLDGDQEIDEDIIVGVASAIAELSATFGLSSAVEVASEFTGVVPDQNATVGNAVAEDFAGSTDQDVNPAIQAQEELTGSFDADANPAPDVDIDLTGLVDVDVGTSGTILLTQFEMLLPISVGIAAFGSTEIEGSPDITENILPRAAIQLLSLSALWEAAANVAADATLEGQFDNDASLAAAVAEDFAGLMDNDIGPVGDAGLGEWAMSTDISSAGSTDVTLDGTLDDQDITVGDAVDVTLDGTLNDQNATVGDAVDLTLEGAVDANVTEATAIASTLSGNVTQNITEATAVAAPAFAMSTNRTVGNAVASTRAGTLNTQNATIGDAIAVTLAGSMSNNASVASATAASLQVAIMENANVAGAVGLGEFTLGLNFGVQVTPFSNPTIDTDIDQDFIIGVQAAPDLVGILAEPVFQLTNQVFNNGLTEQYTITNGDTVISGNEIGQGWPDVATQAQLLLRSVFNQTVGNSVAGQAVLTSFTTQGANVGSSTGISLRAIMSASVGSAAFADPQPILEDRRLVPIAHASATGFNGVESWNRVDEDVLVGDGLFNSPADNKTATSIVYTLSSSPVTIESSALHRAGIRHRAREMNPGGASVFLDARFSSDGIEDLFAGNSFTTTLGVRSTLSTSSLATSDFADLSGVGYTMTVTTTSAGGSPTNRNAVEADAVELYIEQT